jgi:release factor glutamine methyltransferase
LATLGEALSSLTRRLAPLSETASLDSQVLLARLFHQGRAWLLAHPEVPLNSDQEAIIQAQLDRLLGGEPLPYVLGSWEFFGREFQLTPDALIPRPETELLVEQALDWLRAHPDRRFACDVGAGSGCIAISLAASIPDLQVLAVDISEEALQVARQNALLHDVAARIDFLRNDLLAGIDSRFDLICANLPYIPTSDLQQLAVFGREPSLALDGGPDGLALIRRLLVQAPERLLPGSLLLMEIEAGQGTAVASLAEQAFPTSPIRLLQDLSGRDRLLVVEYSPE